VEEWYSKTPKITNPVKQREIAAISDYPVSKAHLQAVAVASYLPRLRVQLLNCQCDRIGAYSAREFAKDRIGNSLAIALSL